MGIRRINFKCSVEGCEKTAASRQLCSMHYARWRRHGDPLVVTAPHGSLRDRIEAKLDRAGGPSACWLWQGWCNNKGYGVVSSGGRRGPLVYVHRAYYEIVVGPIPPLLQLDHVRARGCMHKHCANPAHLEPVTAGENTIRSRPKLCKQGHSYDDSLDNKGRRWCRICRDARNAARYRE